jgi:cysteine-rich repeat protein
VDSTCVDKAIAKFTETYAKIEAKGGCTTIGDVDDVEAKIDACVIDVVSDVAVPNCGNGLQEGTEECDDGDADNFDGCTAGCQTAVVCNTSAFPGGDGFAIDPDTGHCYVSFQGGTTSWYQANDACNFLFGTLVNITSAAEDALVHSIQGPDSPWIGGHDINIEGSFEWFSGEPFEYTHFAPGEPDNAFGNQDCLHLGNAAGEWSDFDCFTNVAGHICEIE